VYQQFFDFFKKIPIQCFIYKIRRVDMLVQILAHINNDARRSQTVCWWLLTARNRGSKTVKIWFMIYIYKIDSSRWIMGRPRAIASTTKASFLTTSLFFMYRVV